MTNDNFAHRAAEWDNPQKEAMTRKFVAALTEKLQVKKEWKALEVGAGTGLVGLQLLPMVDTVVFEDTSAAMLAVLKSKLNGDEKAELVEGEVFAYAKPDIDFVFSCMAFHHIPDIDVAVKHLSAITKPGAMVAIGDIRTEDGSFHRFEPIPHKGFDTDWLAGVFTEAGFEVLETSTYHVLSRERTEGVISNYEQFMLIACKK